MAARQNSSENELIIPVWFNLTKEQLLEYSPPLADKVAITFNGDIESTVSRLNNANPDNKSKFRFQNTEYVFNVAYNNYEAKYLTPEVVAQRLEKGLIEAKKHPELSGWTNDAIKAMLRFYMVESKDLLKENMMTNFFMWDLFPHHKPK